MDRQAFFGAQLWLRRVDEREFLWPENDLPLCEGLTRILPSRVGSSTLPHAASPSPPASPSPVSVAARCAGSFHSASRICYFRPTEANEDQTVLVVEMVVAEPDDASKPSCLFMRLDNCHVYEVAVSAILSVIPPERPRASTPSSLPPFGSLEFGSVSLRLWLDPQCTPVTEARAILVDALRCVEKLRNVHRAFGMLKSQKQNPWTDCFRHNRWVARQTKKSVWTSLLDPAELLRRGQEVMSSDADIEALKMVISNFSQKRGRSARNHGLTGIQEDAELLQTPPAPDRAKSTVPLTEHECFDLVASLVHVFGEDHRPLRQLLGPSEFDPCNDHEGCSKFVTASKSGCVMQKWQRWDEFLQLSNDAFFPQNKRQRTSHTSQYVTDAEVEDMFQSAGEAFASSVVEVEEDGYLQAMQGVANERLRSLEDAAFATLFSSGTKPSAKTNTPVKTGPQQAEALTPVTPQRAQAAPRQQVAPLTPQHLTQSKAEHAFNFHLESRRAHVRQELAQMCLPRRAHQSCGRVRKT